MVSPPPNADLTPVAGAATDVAPLGRRGAKPSHELTADEDVDVADWDRLAALAEFKALLAAKRRFILPATVFFIAYYFALPVLVGYAPRLMGAAVAEIDRAHSQSRGRRRGCAAGTQDRALRRRQRAGQ